MNYTERPAGAYYTSESNKKWYDQRNKDLYKDKLSGMGNVELITKYGVSLSAVTKICKRERDKNEFRNARSKK